MYSKININNNFEYIINEINHISDRLQSLSLDINKICVGLKKYSIFYDNIRKLNLLENKILDEAYIMHNLCVTLEKISFAYNMTEYSILNSFDYNK